MAGLEINYGIIGNCIYNIQQLSACYPAVIRPAVSGQGQGIAEIEYLADLYESLYAALERLSEGTVDYLKCMAAEFKEADKK